MAERTDIKSDSAVRDIPAAFELFQDHGTVKDISHQYEGTEASGAKIWLFTPHGKTNSYYVVIPAAIWRRELIHDENGNVVQVRSRTPGDKRVMLNEIQVVALPPDTKQDFAVKSTELAAKHLQEIFRKGSGVGLGGEVEFSLDIPYSDEYTALRQLLAGQTWPQLLPYLWSRIPMLWRQEILAVEPDAARELNVEMREVNGNPVNGTPNLIRHTIAVMHDVFHRVRDRARVNLASTDPSGKNLANEQWASVHSGDGLAIGAYVEHMSHALHTNSVMANLHMAPEWVKENWEKIANEQGYDDLESFLNDYPDLRYWLMLCLHVSADLPVDEDGYTSESILRATSNLYMYFRNILNGPCYSGGQTLGVQLGEDGAVPADGREATRFLLATAGPTELIPADQSMAQRGLQLVAEGQVINIDRAVTVTQPQQGTELAATHSDIRGRVTYTGSEFLEAIASRALQDPSNGPGKKIRAEYVSRPNSPDHETYFRSVAIQEILSIAATMSVADGFEDVFAWLNSFRVLRKKDADEITYGKLVDGKTYTQRAYEEAHSCLNGDFPQFKIETMERIISLVEQRLEAQKVDNPNLFKTIELARAGLEALQKVGVYEEPEYQRMRPWQKLRHYIEHRAGNWGEFINHLSDEEIVKILSSKKSLLWRVVQPLYGFENPRKAQQFFESQDRGQLMIALNDAFTRHYYYHEQQLLKPAA